MLKQKHFSLVNNNDDLNHDIEQCTKHLENLSTHNQEVFKFLNISLMLYNIIVGK